MGSLLSRKKKTKVLCIGLDNGGKSTIINFLKPAKQKKLELDATVGYESEKFTFKNITFTVLDMSGQSKYRNLWEYYYQEVDAIIFVIDSSDKVRLCVVKEELSFILTHEKLKNKLIPILFCANKKDLPNSVGIKVIEESLELSSIKNPYFIIPTNGLNGEGINEGLDWLSMSLENSTKKKRGTSKITIVT